jgi:hypothetical protein
VIRLQDKELLRDGEAGEDVLLLLRRLLRRHVEVDAGDPPHDFEVVRVGLGLLVKEVVERHELLVVIHAIGLRQHLLGNFFGHLDSICCQCD